MAMTTLRSVSQSFASLASTGRTTAEPLEDVELCADLAQQYLPPVGSQALALGPRPELNG
jgi:hypothetical protein